MSGESIEKMWQEHEKEKQFALLFVANVFIVASELFWNCYLIFLEIIPVTN